MSERLAVAATALGAPEDLVQRSAEARATADGSSADDVLAAWAGGAPMPAVTATPAEAPEPTADAPAVEETTPSPAAAAAPAPQPAAAIAPASTAPAAVAARSDARPILTDQQSRPMATLVMMAGLFVVGLLITVIIPSYTGGDYTHLVPDAKLSAQAEAGLDIYLSEGCWYCHTQLVRPVVADVGLGPATETFADSLDTAAFGIQRIGPDLGHVGSRASLSDGENGVTEADFLTLLTDPTSINAESLHPTYSYLSEGDLAALATYLLESK
jgi:cytochrome c oxidase cbb3-type subunit 2